MPTQRLPHCDTVTRLPTHHHADGPLDLRRGRIARKSAEKWPSQRGAGQEQILTRMRAELGMNLIEIEKARSLREHRTKPDAFDLILRARAFEDLPPTAERSKEAQSLYERALLLDPSSVQAMAWIAYFLIERRPGGCCPADIDHMQRAQQLLARARAIAPDSDEVFMSTVYWLGTVDRGREVIEIAQPAIQLQEVGWLEAMGQAARNRHDRAVIIANGVTNAPAERSEPVPHLLRAGHHPGCCHRAQPVELVDRRDHSGDRATAAEEDRTRPNGTAARAAPLA